MNQLDLLSTYVSSTVQFSDWTQNRFIPSLGTNDGALPLPFQTWHKFKEAYAPELVERAVRESSIPVNHIVDVFGGSGTSALAAQFLGIPSTSIEVNPFLADVITAKTNQYSSDELIYDLRRVVRHSKQSPKSTKRFSSCPPTFIEPGINSRYLFNREVAEMLAAILDGIDSLDSANHRLLFRVLLGGILVSVSNVVVRGKGRRYRKGWANRIISRDAVLEKFANSVSLAIIEIHTHNNRPSVAATILNADARIAIKDVANTELCIFSPPYPNSFDYTDVYNIELWILGYLSNRKDNHVLRHATLSSHVQIKREFSPAPQGAKRLNHTLALLRERRNLLWSSWIPEMVGGYFADLGQVLTSCAQKLNDHGQIWMVVGNSQYGEVQIAVDKILVDLAPTWGLRLINQEPFRSMRSSAQQGGRKELAETLVILAKD